MATREELFEAVRLLRENCMRHGAIYCMKDCPLTDICGDYFYVVPWYWYIPEEGGCKDGRKTN